MFDQISWQTYWTVIALLSVAYYLSVYLNFFRKDFVISFPKRRTTAVNSIESELHQTSFLNEQDNGGTNDNEEAQAQACLDEINAYFEAQNKTKPIKNEVLYGLHHITLKYPSLKTSSYKETLSNVIVTEAENRCSIHISADEIKTVWGG